MVPPHGPCSVVAVRERDPRRRDDEPRKARYCDWFDDKCCFENFDKFWKNNGKYRCKICFQLQNSILILGNLAFIADCNLYFGQNLYNVFSLIPKCIRFSPQITDNSLFSLFMTVKIANNTGFNLYGKYRVVIGRNNGPSLSTIRPTSIRSKGDAGFRSRAP